MCAWCTRCLPGDDDGAEWWCYGEGYGVGYVVVVVGLWCRVMVMVVVVQGGGGSVGWWWCRVVVVMV